DFEFFDHTRHKAIPVATLGLDDLLRLSAVADTRADRTDATLQCCIADGEPTPHLFAQLLLGDDSVAMRYEITEYLEDLRREQYALVSPTELMELCVESTMCKVINHTTSSMHRRNPSAA